MTERVRIAYREAEGALVRILGLVERRGYLLLAVAAEGGALSLTIAARDPGRRLDTLIAQLHRLHDVADVTASPSLESADR